MLELLVWIMLTVCIIGVGWGIALLLDNSEPNPDDDAPTDSEKDGGDSNSPLSP